MDIKSCHVVMPATATSPYHTQIYWNLFFEQIKNRIESLYCSCTRSSQDCVARPGPALVLAVLTDSCPQVWYELGLCQAFGSSPLLLMEETQDLPFPINSDDNLILYSDSYREPLLDGIARYILRQSNVKNPEVICPDIEKIYDLAITLASAHVTIKMESFPLRPIRHARVLWVDDHPDTYSSIIELFACKKIQFDMAHTTMQAVRCLQAHMYSLIITDLNREGSESAGIEFIKNLKRSSMSNLLLTKLADTKTKIINWIDDSLKLIYPPVIVYAQEEELAHYGELAKGNGAFAVLSGIENLICFLSKSFL